MAPGGKVVANEADGGPPGNVYAPVSETEAQESAGRRDETTVARELRNRRDAALRLAPFTSLWGLPGRDPMCPERNPAPSSYGLRRHELQAEVDRCRAAGWSDWELRERFVAPRAVPV